MTVEHSRARPALGQSVHAWSLPYLVSWVERQGADVSMLRRLPGLLAAEDPDARAPEHVVEAAWRLAATLTRDESIGIQVAESLPRGALDLVEYAFRSSASLGLGLERLARYGRVLSDRVAARTEANDEVLLWLVRDVGRTRLHPARTEFALAIAMKLARDGTGHDIVPRRVSFAHPAPLNDQEHRRFFGTRVRFGAGTNSLLLTHATLVGRCRTPTTPWPPSSGAGSNGCWRCRMPERAGRWPRACDACSSSHSAGRQ